MGFVTYLPVIAHCLIHHVQKSVQYKQCAVITFTSHGGQPDNLQMLLKHIELLRWWLLNLIIKCGVLPQRGLDGHFLDFVGKVKQLSITCSWVYISLSLWLGNNVFFLIVKIIENHVGDSNSTEKRKITQNSTVRGFWWTSSQKAVFFPHNSCWIIYWNCLRFKALLSPSTLPPPGSSDFK